MTYVSSRGERPRLLVVSYHPPGLDLPPGRRVEALTNELRGKGIAVDVLTTSFFGVTGDGAIATPDLRSLVARRRALPTGLAQSPRFSRGRLSRLVPPDVTALSWLPLAVLRILARRRDAAYDAVLTTSPPESTHIVGAALAARGTVWIADLRDGWTFEPPVLRSYWPRLEQRLEEALLGRAAALTAASEPIADDLRRRVPRTRVLHLANVFDPSAPIHPPPTPPSPDRFSLVYTGTGSADGKDPRPFLRGLEALLERRPALAQEVEVLFAGAFLAEELEAMRAENLSPVVRFVGRLPHAQALGLQHAADGFLLILSPNTVGVTTGKVFEYLAAVKPIFVIGTGAGAELATAAGPHTVATDATREGLASALEQYLDRWKSGSHFGPYPTFDPFAYTPARSVDGLLRLLVELGALRRA